LSQTSSEKALLSTKFLNAWFGNHRAITDITLDFSENTVTSLIGPSGCGKSTFLRCLNRLHEEVPGTRIRGHVYLEDENIYARSINPVKLRRQIGMVFQKPNPFPVMSIFDNVVAGLKLAGIRKKAILEEIAQKSLQRAALWDEVKDKLQEPGLSLSGGQQQRLCIARALALEPQVLLMDEPTSALDPISAAKIEELVKILKKDVTIVIVTHNMQQATRISDRTAFFLMGEVVEFGDTKQLFSNPRDQRTENYVTGRFG